MAVSDSFYCTENRFHSGIDIYLFVVTSRTLVKSVKRNFFFLFLNQTICCGYSKDGSFEHPKHTLKLMGKKIFTNLLSNILYF